MKTLRKLIVINCLGALIILLTYPSAAFPGDAKAVKAKTAKAQPAKAKADKIGIVFDARVGYLFSTGDMRSVYPEIGVAYLFPFHRQRVSVSLSFSYYQRSQESEQTEQYLGVIESEYSIGVMPLFLEGAYRYRFGKWAVQGSFGPMLAMIGGHVSADNQNGPILPREEFSQVSLGLAASLGGGYQIGPGDLELTWRWLTAGLDREESETSADVGGMAMILGYRYSF